MTEQYFTMHPTTGDDIYEVEWNLNGFRFKFYTGNSVFSKKGVDFGSMLLTETVIAENERFGGRMLDMGCGYGPIGIMIASQLSGCHVDMADINERALDLANMNIAANHVQDRVKAVSSSAFEEIDGMYDIIVTNPPIRAGKQVVFSFYEGAFDHLNPGGRLYVVIQKKQGAPSSREKLEMIFGSCDTAAKKSGYFIFRAEKH